MDIHNDKEEKRLYEFMQSLGLPVTKFKDGLNSEISEYCRINKFIYSMNRQQLWICKAKKNSAGLSVNT